MSSAVIERRNREVFEALEAGNLRQAAALCQKRIKKGEKSDNLLVRPLVHRSGYSTALDVSLIPLQGLASDRPA